MKIVKILLFLALITYSTQRVEKSEKKTIASKKFQIKESSNLLTSYKLFIYTSGSKDGDDWTESMWLNSYLSTSSSMGRVGMVFTFSGTVKSNLSALLADFVNPVDGKTYKILQFKNFKSNAWGTYNPSWEGKYFWCDYYKTKTTTVKLYFKFPYSGDYDIDYDRDLSVTLLNSLNTLTSSEHSKVNKYITDTQTEASTYLIARTQKLAYDSDSFNAATALTAQQTSKTTKTGELNTLQTSATATQKLIATKQSELVTLRAQQNAKLDSAGQQATMITNTNNNVAVLNAQKASGTVDKTFYETNVANALAGLNSYWDNIVKETEAQSAAAEACRTAFVSGKDLAAYNTCQNTILPVESH
jgi:hypothetical protein